MIKEKTKAPDFMLIDQDNRSHSLGDYKDKWIVIYFYLKDNTPCCTTEAKNFSDNIDKFELLGAKVIGISSDSYSSHKKFAALYDLRLTLLSDPKKAVIKKYQASGIITKRISYLIDPKGIIAKAYPSVNPAKHAEEILNDIENLKGYS